MNILLIGSGGREHALAWAISNSPLCDRLFVAPGNPGIGQIARNQDLKVTDHAAVIAFCRAEKIGLVVVGPEAPLVAGLADDLAAAGIKCFGPKKFPAQLEGSKGFTKDICAKYNIPTAAYGRFKDKAAALAYLEAHGAPIVIKADGLAAGKGVTVAMDMATAREAVEDIFSGKFGGAECVIEEFLEGEEASFFVLTDGKSALPLATAQDHKRVGDGDTGPNTGGMGAYSPAPCMTPALCEEALETIVKPTIRALQDMGHPYVGVLYAGLILTKDGPKLIEYNCRFGDPECQVLMMRLQSDLVDLLEACARGELASAAAPALAAESAMTVVVAAKGYPATPASGGRIANLPAAEAHGAKVFHAGTATTTENALVAKGGRVLNVTATGATLQEARDRAYAALAEIHFNDGFWRNDIGWRELARQSA
jgi:phosphoribosylamine--glycine ligase